MSRQKTSEHSTISYLLSMKYFTTAVVLSAVLGQAVGICPGFNYGIGNQQNLGNGVSRCTYPYSPAP